MSQEATAPEVPTLIPTGTEDREVVQFGVDILLQTIDVERQLMSCSSALCALSNRTQPSKSLTLALKLATVMVYGAREMLAVAIVNYDKPGTMPALSQILVRSTGKLSELAIGFIR